MPPSRTWTGFLSHFFSTCLFGLCRKQVDLGEWQTIIISLTRWWHQSLVYQKWLSLLDRINTYSGNWYAAITMEKKFFFLSVYHYQKWYSNARNAIAIPCKCQKYTFMVISQGRTNSPALGHNLVHKNLGCSFPSTDPEHGWQTDWTYWTTSSNYPSLIGKILVCHRMGYKSDNFRGLYLSDLSGGFVV